MINKTKVAIVGIEWDVVDLIDSIPELEIAGFFDLVPSELGGLTYLGPDTEWETIKKTDPSLKVVLALDDPDKRSELLEHYGSDSVISLPSPHAHISKRATIGIGSVIQRGAVIMPRAFLGDACKINVNATVHHEAQIGNFCTLAPGAQILGRVVLEEGVYVGAGAIIRQRCRIGSGSIIGAGAVVVHDVPPDVTVVGIPAKEKVRV